MIEDIDGVIKSEGIEVLIYSPTLQNGVDIQSYFDLVITFADGIIAPSQSMQMAKRVRNAGEYWFIAPRKTVDIVSISHLQGKDFDRKLEKLHQAAVESGLCPSKFWSKQGYWQRLVGEIEKAYNSEYLRHLIGETFENVETVMWAARDGGWQDAVSRLKSADTGRSLESDPNRGRELAESDTAARTEQECWDMEAYQYQKLYPKLYEQFSYSLSQAHSEQDRAEVLSLAKIWRDKRLNRLKLLYMAQNPDEIDLEMFLGKREGYFTAALERLKKVEYYELAKRLELWNLAFLVKRQGIEKHTNGFVWWSDAITELYARFCSDNELMALMPDIETQKEFFHIIKKCMSAMGFEKQSESLREKSEDLHPNGVRGGLQRLIRSRQVHFVGWTQMEDSGSNLFQKMYECVVDSIADLVDEEREQFKLRKAVKLLNTAMANAPNDSATYQLAADYQAMLCR